MKQNIPFFAKFLDSKTDLNEVRAGSILTTPGNPIDESAGESLTKPGKPDESTAESYTWSNGYIHRVTLKYPSDNDEGTVG